MAELLGENSREEFLQKYEKVKLELKEIYDDKVQGQIIRNAQFLFL